MGGRSMTIPSNRTRYLVPATIWVSQNLKRSAHGNAHGGTPDYFYGSKNQVTSGLFSAEDGVSWFMTSFIYVSRHSS
jgi:hypothetical protein